MDKCVRFLKMRHSLVVMVFLAGTLALIFQNCADPLNLADEDTLQLSSSLPFAYKANIDTLSYMSCSGVGAGFDPRTAYTFRAGAYEATSGLGLRPEFAQMVKNFDSKQRAEFLQTSPVNINTAAQLSIRQVGRYETALVYGSGSGGLKEATDVGTFWGNSLSSPEIATLLGGLVEGKRINYLPGLRGLGSSLFETSIRVFNNETAAQNLRDQMSQSAVLLALGFTEDYEGGSTLLKKPGERDNKVYGSGYLVNFTLPSRLNHLAGTRRVIDLVREVDLETGLQSGSGVGVWNCPRDLQFEVVHTADAPVLHQATACRKLADIYFSGNPIFQARLNILRRVLRAEDYWADPERLCVIPKSHVTVSCYEVNKPAGQVDYYFDGASVCSTPGNCPHWLSICLRQ